MRRSTRERATDNLLLAAAMKRPIEQVDQLDAADVLLASRYHRLAPLVYLALKDNRPDIASLLREDRDKALTHHLRVTLVLAALRELLGDIDWLAFKGPYLSELAHPVPGLRSYGDVDVLVRASRLRQAYERVAEAGWRSIDTVETLEHPVLPGEITIGNALMIPVDMHWSMVHSAPLRRRFPVPAGQVLERRVEAQIGGVRAGVPASPDALVHVCLHAALAGATKLLHLLDADQVARSIVDWDEVVRRSREWGATATTAVVLGRARQLFDTPLPPELFGLLGLSRAFASLMRAVDMANPAVTVRRDISMPRRVAMGVRPSALLTVGTVARNRVVRVAQRLHPQREPETGQAGPSTVAAYLLAVGRATRDPAWA